MELHALAQAAQDALTAAEQRGFERGLAFVEAKLQASSHLCIFLDSLPETQECRVQVEIVIDDETGRCLESRKVPLSDVLYEQWDACKGSTQGVRDAVKRSLARLDHIIANWGTAAASEKAAMERIAT